MPSKTAIKRQRAALRSLERDARAAGIDPADRAAFYRWQQQQLDEILARSMGRAIAKAEGR